MPEDAPFIKQMRLRLQTRAGHQAYDQHKSTIESVFGIIKEAMRFRRFSLRGLSKVYLEWKLVSLSYNLSASSTWVRSCKAREKSGGKVKKRPEEHRNAKSEASSR